MPPNRFESEVESFLEGSHGDRTHIKRADHHTVTPLCGTLLDKVTIDPARQHTPQATETGAQCQAIHEWFTGMLSFLSNRQI